MQYVKLGDLDLTFAQSNALFDLLNERVAATARAAAQVELDRAASATYDKRYERVRELARETAAQHRALPGVSAVKLAELNWDLFCSGDGWFSYMDVDEYFDPSADPFDTFESGWVNAYVEALPSEVTP